MKKTILQLTAVLLLGACAPNQSDTDVQAQETATDFAEAYFNYDYKTAGKHSTPESEKWLRYAASNVTQEVVDLYNVQERRATAEVADFYWTNDTTATVSIRVSHYVADDSIAAAPRIAEEGLFHLTVVRRDGEMLVRMASPLRSEKQSRD